jgi:hypothetical protein
MVPSLPCQYFIVAETLRKNNTKIFQVVFTHVEKGMGVSIPLPGLILTAMATIHSIRSMD